MQISTYHNFTTSPLGVLECEKRDCAGCRGGIIIAGKFSDWVTDVYLQQKFPIDTIYMIWMNIIYVYACTCTVSANSSCNHGLLFPVWKLECGQWSCGGIVLWNVKDKCKLIPWGRNSCALIMLIRIASPNLLKCTSKCANLTIISRLRDLKLEQLDCIVTVGKSVISIQMWWLTYVNLVDRRSCCWMYILVIFS